MRGKIFTLAVLSATAFALAACGRGDTFKTAGVGAQSATAFPTAPTRAPYPGCAWTHLEGAGLRLWSQACQEEGSFERLVADDSKPILWKEAVVEGQVVRSVAFQVFDKEKDAEIESILPAVLAASSAPNGATCALSPIEGGVGAPQGVKRFVLAPVGETKAVYERALAGSGDPPTPPCGSMGPSEVGDRYFEIQDARADKVVFIELGSDLPIFDHNTLEVLGAKHEGGADSHGEKKGGH